MATIPHPARDKNEKLYTAEQNAFNLGVVSTKDPAKIELEQIQLCENAFPSRSGRVKKRPGFTNMLDSDLPSGQGIRRFKSEDGDIDSLIVWTDDSVAEVLDDGTYRWLSCRLFTAPPALSHDQFFEEVFFSDGASATTGNLWVIQRATEAKAARIVTPDALTGVVDVAGADGNGYTFEIKAPTVLGQALSVSMDGTDIVVNPAASPGTLTISSTVTEVRTALNAAGAIAAVTTWDGTSSDVVEALPAMAFWAGADIGDLWLDTASSTRGYTHLAARTFGERLFGIDADDKSNYRYSDPDDGTTWGSGSVVSPGGTFTALLEIDRAMLLFQAERILSITGTDPTTWEVVPVGSEGMGCLAPSSLSEVEGVAVYYSPRGLTSFEGSRPSPLSDNVFNVADTSRSLLPSVSGEIDGMFTVAAHEFLYVFYKSDADNDGCDRAMVFDFRTGAWGGPYLFEFEAIAGCKDLTVSGDAGSLLLLTTDGRIMREDADLSTDDDGDYAFAVGFRTIDADRATLDKVWRSVRVGYKTGGATTLTVDVYAEDETSVRTGATQTFAISGAEEGVLSMALPAGFRARSVWVKVSDTSAVDVELSYEAVDLFFVQTR